MHGLCVASLLVGLAVQPGALEKEWEKHMRAGEAALEQYRFSDAEQAFAAAVEAAQSGHGHNRRFPAAQVKLAAALLGQGKYLQAEHLCQRAWPLLARLHGAESAEVARCLNLQAETCWALGLHEQAENLAKLAYGLRKKKLPREHYDLAESVQTLATMKLAYEEETTVGEKFVAVAHDDSMARVSLEIQEKALGKDDPRLAACLRAAAQTFSRWDKEGLQKAEKHLLRALRLLIRDRGERHPVLADYWTELARIYHAQGKHTLAEQAQQKALDRLRRHFGATHPRLSQALMSLSEIRKSLGRAAASAAALEEASRCHFAGLSDDELCACFDRLPPGSGSQDEYLLEMIRRQGAVFRSYLTRKHNEVHAVRRKYDVNSLRDPPPNLEILTALRRLQKKADPLTVEVRGVADCEAIFPHLPAFEVALTNVDFQKKLVGIQAGGDYRHGRQERWRFDVRDGRGHAMPCKEPPSGGLGGGLFRYENLKPGNSWDTVLNMRSFVDLVPGDYTVTIQYHDRLGIGSYAHTGGLIVSRSEPFRLHVQPRVIDLTKEDRRVARQAVAGLDDKAAVQILAGSYTKAAHEWIDPKSPAGKLLGLGWTAVPTLLDELENSRLSPGHRAWMLALLFSITSWHDPRQEEGVLADYSSKEAGWALRSGSNGQLSGFSAGWGGGGTVTGGKIDEAAQRAFAKRWRAFRGHLVARDKGS
jgi:tetratricopeptide (TPR) repeat protein